MLEGPREQAQPLTAEGVALRVLEAEGFDVNDAPTVRLIEKRLLATARRRRTAPATRALTG